MPSSADRARDHLPRIETLAALNATVQSQRAALSNEILMRASIFAALVSATVIGISFLAQATQFSAETAAMALVLLPVTLFVGLMTFLRAVEINRQDGAALATLRQVQQAYARIDPGAREMIGGFVAAADDMRDGGLGQGRRQHLGNVLRSLTTTSSVIAALNSVLAGTLASIIAARLGGALEADLVVGSVVAVAAAVGQVTYAARAREAPLTVRSRASAPPRHGQESRSTRPRVSTVSAGAVCRRSRPHGAS